MVERALSMREVPGSIPGNSTFYSFILKKVLVKCPNKYKYIYEALLPFYAAYVCQNVRNAIQKRHSRPHRCESERAVARERDPRNFLIRNTVLIIFVLQTR